MKDTTKATIVRYLLALCIGSSIGLMYYTYIVKQEYKIFTNPGGPTIE